MKATLRNVMFQMMEESAFVYLRGFTPSEGKRLFTPVNEK